MDNRLFSERINRDCFMLEVPEYYQPGLPNYFRESRSSGRAMVNGVFVSDKEYQELTGNAVERDNYVPSPIYRAEELNMCLSSCTGGVIIDMIDNMVPFKFTNIHDILKVVEIIDGYTDELGPYESRSSEIKIYLAKARTAAGKLRSAYAEIKRDMDLNAGRMPEKPAGLIGLLKEMR